MELPAVATDRVEDVSHFVQSVRIAETEARRRERQVAIFLRDQCCAYKPRQDAQLLSGTMTTTRNRATVECGCTPKVGSTSTLERGPETGLPIFRSLRKTART